MSSAAVHAANVSRQSHLSALSKQPLLQNVICVSDPIDTARTNPHHRFQGEKQGQKVEFLTPDANADACRGSYQNLNQVKGMRLTYVTRKQTQKENKLTCNIIKLPFKATFSIFNLALYQVARLA